MVDDQANTFGAAIPDPTTTTPDATTTTGTTDTPTVDAPGAAPGLTDWLSPGAESSALFSDHPDPAAAGVGAGMVDDQGNSFGTFTDISDPSSSGWESGLSIPDTDPDPDMGAREPQAELSTSVALLGDPRNEATSLDVEGRSSGEAGPAPGGDDAEELDIDPITGQPYVQNTATGQTEAIQATGVDSSGNPIYQAPTQAGGDTFEVDPSGTAVSAVGPIDTSTWDSPAQQDSGSWTDGQNDWSDSSTTSDSGGGGDSSGGSGGGGSSDSGYSGDTGSSGGESSGDTAPSDPGYSDSGSSDSGYSDPGPSESTGVSEGAPVEESPPPVVSDSGGDG
jgi:hypothetical protein